jgi:uncharacterized repeat protein (TIGR03833 family)
MTKKPPNPNTIVTGTLTHSPFATLEKRAAGRSVVAEISPTAPVKRTVAVRPSQPDKVRLRLESVGRAGKVVTRISGLPRENLEAIAGRLRKALGCGANLDGTDVLLLGSLAERATQWLDHAGDLRTIRSEAASLRSPEPTGIAVTEPATSKISSASGTRRSEIRRGQRVAIVMKVDQGSGKLTEGIVRDLLTNSEVHPRGIKVRLESGEVGRVRVVLG